MDNKTIFTKTAKGVGEAVGKTRALSRDLRTVLKEIDGQTSLEALLGKLSSLSKAEIHQALSKLSNGDYIREFVPPALESNTLDLTTISPLEIGPRPPGQRTRINEVLRMQLAARAKAEAEALERAKRAEEERERMAQEEFSRYKQEEKARRDAQQRAMKAAQESARLAAEQQSQLSAERHCRRESDANAQREADEMLKIEAAAEAEQRIQREAEERARREAEESDRQQAEEQAQRAAEEQARQIEEERARREAAELVRLMEEQLARQEAEEQAARAAEEQARLIAAERARQEAEESARREAEQQARREAEELAKRNAEIEALRLAEEQARIRQEEARREAEMKERMRREAEQRAEREAEERARHEAEEKARIEAEAQARRIAEEQARREAEERARREAEEKARQEAEANRQREARLRQEAEMQAKQAEEQRQQLEAQARAEREREEAARRAREEKLRLEAAEQARRDAEALASAEEIKREFEALERQQAEDEARRKREKAKRDLEELARRRAEAKAKKEKEEQERKEKEEAEARINAEAQAKQEVERWMREAAEQRKQLGKSEQRDSEPETIPSVTATPATGSAAVHTVRQSELRSHEEIDIEEPEPEQEQPDESGVTEPIYQNAEETGSFKRSLNSYIRPRNWLKPVLSGLLLMFVLGIGLLHVISFDGKAVRLEQAASAQLQQPVKIGAVHFVLLPVPRWRLEEVKIGAAKEITADRIDAVVDWSGILGNSTVFTSVELHSPVITEQALGKFLFGPSSRGQLIAHRIIISNARLASKNIALPSFNAIIDMDASGAWHKAAIDSLDRKTRMRLVPGIKGINVELNAETFKVPFGSSLMFDKFSGKGMATDTGIALSEFVGDLYGGIVAGSAILQWTDGWTLSGSIDAKLVDAALVAPGLLQSGKLQGNASYALHAPTAGNLFAAPRLEGYFAVQNGTLLGVDFAKALRNANSGGHSSFSELTGSYVHEAGKTQLRKLYLGAGLLSVRGAADIDDSDKVSGRLIVELTSQTMQARSNLIVSGTRQELQFNR